ncbi:MGH1-like glycoside hydrolase domain-containing protein [Actinoplanes regularis]|uniref:Mannosylglycerate hydrolase MGH1-like glycoside hydrolase domain-containing protein n=1 Tax=Actinoplanes regularis TaxID=52697 RepID=A0A239ISB1_9ACTN|nr:hypothetical protein [Actinoplanes regularis]GIE91507.1 hypothetical protein Are01nite_79870 [Actinoplanes regularis]SNS96469.1 hypothetical protein SAMN06264365_13093 [Actinoplanes regularis]
MLQRGEAAQERGLGIRQVQVAVAARQWKATAGEIRTAMLRLWDGSRFLARNAETGEIGTSTLDLMPIAVGAGLPGQVSDTLAGRIAAHLTAHGPATEPTNSAQYASDGYWRGPIWAPSTVLIEDCLRRAGHVTLADEISQRFRVLCEKSGFAENFDAETGTGLRDRAYTWTAASYLIFAAVRCRRAHALRRALVS